MRFEAREVCQECGGSGLYVGMAERDGVAVVCAKCSGTGCYTFVHEYEEFSERRRRPGVERVFRCNPGIVIGTNAGRLRLAEFGGMPADKWERGEPFPEQSEDRAHTCPAWWYQTADYKKKPHWNECGFGTFSSCHYFPTKATCWARWDREQQEEREEAEVTDGLAAEPSE